jgi:hypothetical protein
MYVQPNVPFPPIVWVFNDILKNSIELNFLGFLDKLLTHSNWKWD